MTLKDRIIRYLSKSPGEWVPYEVIYAAAKQHGYSYDVITHAINEVKKEMNIGSEYIQAGDRHTSRSKGNYLIYYDMQEEVKKQIQDALAFFEELP